MSVKRQLLVDTALELFYRQGINAVGINEVLQTSGVAKRTLYNHFESKEALVIAALQQRHQVFITWLESVLEKATTDRQIIESLFDGLADWFEGRSTQLGPFRGCFFINTRAEFADGQSAIAQFCQSHKQEVADLISAKSSSKNQTLINAMVLLKEGAIVSTAMSGNGEKTCAQSKTVLLELCQ